MEIQIGSRVSCPPNEYGLEDLLYLDTVESTAMMERRLGTIVWKHPKERFYLVQVESISGKPSYKETFKAEELEITLDK